MNARIALFALMLPAVACAAADPKLGKELHDKQCTSCHVRLVGGDGSGIYTRKDRIIESLPALRQRVAMCASQVNGALSLAQEDDITAYLNQRFYKFK